MKSIATIKLIISMFIMVAVIIGTASTVYIAPKQDKAVSGNFNSQTEKSKKEKSSFNQISESKISR